MPNDDVLMHVMADLTIPGGGRVEGHGVTPDVPVPLSRAALLEGRDPVLEAAIEWIRAPRSGDAGRSRTDSEDVR
jgi:C-terminal processing protease CtpA/Prc